MRAAKSNTPPAFAMPPGACDAHFHVFEPGYPYVPDPLYTFPDGTVAAYLAMTAALGIERMILVQPTFYGTDNSLLAYVLKRLGPRCGGVIRIEEDITDAELEEAIHEGLFDAYASGVELQTRHVAKSPSAVPASPPWTMVIPCPPARLLARAVPGAMEYCTSMGELTGTTFQRRTEA